MSKMDLLFGYFKTLIFGGPFVSDILTWIRARYHWLRLGGAWPVAMAPTLIYSATLIALTQKVWSKRLGRVIPEAEAVEIIRHWRNFLELLKEVKRNGKQ